MAVLRLVALLCLMAACGGSAHAQPTAEAPDLRQLNESLRSVTERVMPSVVHVVASGYAPVESETAPSALLAPPTNTGSGVVAVLPRMVASTFPASPGR